MININQSNNIQVQQVIMQTRFMEAIVGGRQADCTEKHILSVACIKASKRAGKRADKRADKRAGNDKLLATSVDHIVPLFAGGSPYDWSNLQSLCDYIMR